MKQTFSKVITSLVEISVLVLAVGTVSLFGMADKSMQGQQLPPLQLQYITDEPETINKPILLEFWATWCPPCRRSIPHLNEIYHKYKERGLVVIGVSKEQRSTIKKFMKETPMDYCVAQDSNGRLNKAFQIRGIPHAVLVNKEGTIVWEGHPLVLTDEEIEKIVD